MATVLLVEDDEIDAEAFRRRAARRKQALDIIWARDGSEALDRIRDPATPRVDFVVVDLNLPRMTGTDFLAAIEGDDALAATPRFILTSSDSPHDRELARRHAIDGYFVKSSDGYAIDTILERMCDSNTQ